MAQKIDSLLVNLYTDSLKRGTFNYINIDGQLSNGRYLPLDSTHLSFSATAGHFSGNNLWIEPNFSGLKITVTVVLKSNPALHSSFDVYVKQVEPNEKLKTTEELLEEMRNKKKQH